jgi:uncharacterized protein with PhoU and TrkA domain
MLLSSSPVITSSQSQEESSLQGKIEEQSLMLRRKIEELNKNTVVLIAEAGKLIQESKQLSGVLKSFEDSSTARRVGQLSKHRGDTR